jgi:hypothetical protein
LSFNIFIDYRDVIEKHLKRGTFLWKAIWFNENLLVVVTYESGGIPLGFRGTLAAWCEWKLKPDRALLVAKLVIDMTYRLHLTYPSLRGAYIDSNPQLTTFCLSLYMIFDGTLVRASRAPGHIVISWISIFTLVEMYDYGA